MAWLEISVSTASTGIAKAAEQLTAGGFEDLDHIRADQNNGCRNTHRKCRNYRGGGCKRGASSENENQNGVFHNDSAKNNQELIFFCHYPSPPFAVRISNAANAALTAFWYPAVV